MAAEGIGVVVMSEPVGGVSGGIAGGAAMDCITIGVDSAIHWEFRTNGQIACWD